MFSLQQTPEIISRSSLRSCSSTALTNHLFLKSVFHLIWDQAGYTQPDVSARRLPSAQPIPVFATLIHLPPTGVLRKTPEHLLRHDFSQDTESALEHLMWAQGQEECTCMYLLFLICCLGRGRKEGVLGSVTIEVSTCSLLSTMCFSINLLTLGKLALYDNKQT